MEIIDILDINGQKTGTHKSRADIHRDGDYHLAIEVWLFNNHNELLIQKRSANKDSHPNLWEVSCSGHVDSDEASLEAALRELNEELGITSNATELQFVQRFFEPAMLDQGRYINNEFKDLYLLPCNFSLDKFTFPPSEITALKWISITELKEQIAQNDPQFVPHPVGYPILFKTLHENKNPT